MWSHADRVDMGLSPERREGVMQALAMTTVSLVIVLAAGLWLIQGREGGASVAGAVQTGPATLGAEPSPVATLRNEPLVIYLMADDDRDTPGVDENDIVLVVRTPEDERRAQTLINLIASLPQAPEAGWAMRIVDMRRPPVTHLTDGSTALDGLGTYLTPAR